MASNTQDDFGALAIVVDSSVALAANWSLILSSYFGPYLRGLMEQYPGTYRIGFVTYGTSDSLPSSVLCKRFFTDFTPVTNVMKDTEEIQQLSLGSTPSGGTRGMAALEGLVAAIELFDILSSSYKATRKMPSHILHITASFPDNAKHPQANSSPVLDETTWETLPEELSKRKIQLSSLVLNPKNKKIPELHSSPSLNTAPTPWFPVRAPHAAYLASLGLPLKVPTNIQGVKRPAEKMNNVEQPPEKRHQPNIPSAGAGSPPQRPGQSTANPNMFGTPTQSQPTTPGQPPFPILQALPFPIPPINSTQKYPWPGLPPGLSSLTPSDLVQKYKVSEQNLNQLRASLPTAQQAGDFSKAEAIKNDLAKWEPIFLKLRFVAMGYLVMLRRLQPPVPPGAGSNSSGSQPQSQPTPNSNPNPSQPPSNPNPNLAPPPTAPSPVPKVKQEPLKNTVPPSPALAAKPSPKPGPKPSPKPTNSKPSPKPNPKPSPSKQTPQVPAGASSIASTAASASASGLQVPPSMSPEVVVQMQKLVEQNGRQQRLGMSPNLNAANVPQQQQPGQGMDGSSMNMNPGNMGMSMPGGGGMGFGQPGQPGGPTQQPPGAPPAGGNASMAMANPQNGNNGPIPAWSGVLFLPGDPKSIRKDLKFAVSAMSANIAECRVNTWPTEMTLIQSHDSVVSHPEFQHWAKKTRPVVCTLKPHARSSDVRQNMIIEQMFKGLEKMIMGSRTYIVSSWPLPSGAQTNNVIFAYVPNHGLIGAFFPVTGIPEMPKSVPGIPAVPVPGSSPALSASNIMTALAALKVPQEVAQRILQLPQEMQMQALRTLAQQQRSLGRGGPVGMPQGGMGVGGGGGGGPGAGAGAGQGHMGLQGMQGMQGMSPGQKPGGPGGGAGAGAMLRMQQQQPGMGLPMGMMQNMQGANMAGMQGIQRAGSGQPDGGGGAAGGNQMAALLSGLRANIGGGMVNMGGMNMNNAGHMSGGSMNQGNANANNIANMGNMMSSIPNVPGMGNMGGVSMGNMQNMMQRGPGVFGGGGGPGGAGAHGGNVSMDMLQSFMHRNGQEGQGGAG